MSKELGEIQRSLGRIEQGLDDLRDKVKHNCETTEKSISLLNKKVDSLETFKDNLQGKMTILGSVSGFIGGIISMLIDYFVKKM